MAASKKYRFKARKKRGVPLYYLATVEPAVFEANGKTYRCSPFEPFVCTSEEAEKIRQKYGSSRIQTARWPQTPEWDQVIHFG